MRFFCFLEHHAAAAGGSVGAFYSVMFTFGHIFELGLIILFAQSRLLAVGSDHTILKIHLFCITKKTIHMKRDKTEANQTGQRPSGQREPC